MNAHASNLDIDRFRKIHAHVVRGASDGERDNARRMAEAMAAKAGMTFEEAVSETQREDEDSTSAGATDWTEAFRREAAAQREEQLREKASKRVEVLTRYRTVFAVFEPTDRERALRRAIQPFSKFMTGTSPAGHRAVYTIKLDRCRGEVCLGSITKRTRNAVEGAYPMPADFAAALDEVKAWDRLRRDREAFVGGEWQMDMEVDARRLILEEMLSHSPVLSWGDLEARFDWNRHQWEQQFLSPEKHERDDPFLDRLRADFKILRAQSLTDTISSGLSDTQAHREPGAQSGHRTTTQRRADVLSMLDTNPALSDREIARRIGVSPQTVSTWRRRRAEQVERAV